LAGTGFVLVNSTHTFDELGLGPLFERFQHDRLLTVPATEIAQRHTGRPVPNAVLLGGFAALTSEVSMAAVSKAVRDRFAADPSVAERNVAAAAEAYAHVRRAMTDGVERVMLSAPAD
jgi:pyruvate ferredoxin oxidoreductase gamma subunit